MNLEIPKNVRKALQKQVAMEAHPAADLLNAYAERSLSESEDALIAGHLAACRDCREVVFLAASAVETSAPVVETPAAEPRTVTWRHWAIPGTALLAVAVAFVVMNRTGSERNQATQEARVVSSQPAASDSVSPSAVPAPASVSEAPRASRAAVSSANRDSKSVEKKSKTLQTVNEAVASPPAIIAKSVPAGGFAPKTAAIGGRVQNGLPDYQGNVQNQIVPSGPSARTSNMATQGAQATALSSQNSDVYGPVPPPPLPLDQTSAKFEADTTAKVNLKSRGASRVASAPVFSFSGTEPRRNAISRMAIQFWRITADGHVEHFIQNQWNRTLIGVQKSFRVVAYLQNHVWAGGSGPELYHSADNGETWEAMHVKSADSELSGTMQSIRAQDEKHVAIVADDGSLWVTNDGGKTWDKQ